MAKLSLTSGRRRLPYRHHLRSNSGSNGPIAKKSHRFLAAGPFNCPKQAYCNLARDRGLVVRLEDLESLVDLFPVHDVPPGLEIFGAAIVVFEVIGMFPDVVAKNGEQALGDRIVLVRRGSNLHLAAGLARQPY